MYSKSRKKRKDEDGSETKNSQFKIYQFIPDWTVKQCKLSIASFQKWPILTGFESPFDQQCFRSSPTICLVLFFVIICFLWRLMVKLPVITADGHHHIVLKINCMIIICHHQRGIPWKHLTLEQRTETTEWTRVLDVSALLI